MATPNDPTTSHGSLDAVIAAYMQAVEAGEVPNRQRPGVECPRQELNLVLDLRRGACASVTLQGQYSKEFTTTGLAILLRLHTLWRFPWISGRFSGKSRLVWRLKLPE